MSKKYECDRCGKLLNSHKSIKIKLEFKHRLFPGTDIYDFCEDCASYIMENIFDWRKNGRRKKH